MRIKHPLSPSLLRFHPLPSPSLLPLPFPPFLTFPASNQVLSQSLQQVRDAAVSTAVSILFTYRKFCATTSSSGQLILPEALKLLPLYTLGESRERAAVGVQGFRVWG